MKNGDAITVYGIYRSPDGKDKIFFESLEQQLQYIHSQKQKFLITGDFNIDVLDIHDTKTSRLKDLLRGFNLEWSVNSPTRVTTTSRTAIDNVVTNILNVTVSVLSTAVSDHDAVLAAIGNGRPLNVSKLASLGRDTRPDNIRLLKKRLEQENWDRLDEVPSLDQRFDLFHKCFTYHLDVCCPIKSFKTHKSHRVNNWITTGILTSRETLKCLWQHSKITNDLEFKTYFKNYKTIYKKVIRAAKAREIIKKLKQSDNFSKSAWSVINNKKSSKSMDSITLTEGGNTIVDPSEVAETLNQYFATVAEANSNIYTSMSPNLNGGPAVSMVLASVTDVEVAQAIHALKSKKTTDVNCMSTWLLKQCYGSILKPLTKLVNLSFEKGVFPNCFKTAKVIPIFKKGDSLQASNYRPISILPVLSKVFEKLFVIRLLNFFDKHNILSTDQFGFRQGRSTIDAITHLVDVIAGSLDKRKMTLSVFLDLSKAFDCVDHNILLNKLYCCGVRGLPHEWLKSYLNNRTQQVQANGTLSQPRSLKYGVPQGSILGPVLFLVYVNDLNSCIREGYIVQYADDTTLTFSSNSKERTEIITLDELNSCVQFLAKENLKVNKEKTNYMVFRGGIASDEYRPTTMIGGCKLQEVGSTKFLGILLDRGLTWTDHVDSVCRRVSSGLFVLRNLSKTCPQSILLMAYYGLIYPHLSYGIILWGGCTNRDFNRLFVLQKKAIRIIAKLNFRESCRDAFRNLNILTLACIYILETTLYCRFKCRLTQGQDVHNYHTRSCEVYRLDQHRLQAYSRLPSQAGVGMLNKVPESIKSENNDKKFKTALRRFLASKVFYSVGEFMDHSSTNSTSL